MAIEDLGSYIADQRANGISDSDIRSALIQAGWPEETINQSLPVAITVPISPQQTSKPKLNFVIAGALFLIVVVVAGTAVLYFRQSKKTASPRVSSAAQKFTDRAAHTPPKFTSTKLVTITTGDKLTVPVLFDNPASPYFFIVGESWAFAHGQKSSAYKFIGQFAYNFKLGHVGFTAQRNDGTTAVVYNGREVGGSFSEPSEIAMPENGSEPRYAFVAKQGEQSLVVIDGKASKPYDFVNRPQFTPDGKHVMYEATVGKESFVVFDGVESKHYGSVKLVPDSWAGGRDAFEAHDICPSHESAYECPAFMVIDGKEGKRYDSIGEFSTHASADGTHFVYTGITGKKVVVVVDGVESQAYDGVDGQVNEYGWSFFSPVGNHVLFVASSNDQQFVVKDGAAGKHYAWITSLSITPDAQHVAYIASPQCNQNDMEALSFGQQTAKKCTTVVVKDGQETPTADLASSAILSRDGKQVSYITAGDCKVDKNDPSGYGLAQCSRTQVFRDGKPVGSYNQIFGSVVYSPGGSHIAYLAGDLQKNLEELIIDSKEYPLKGESPDSSELYNIFSIDDQHIALVLKAADKTDLWLDGIKLQTDDEIYARQFSLDSKRLRYLYRQGNDIFLGEYSF
jgi:hypothetical protein